MTFEPGFKNGPSLPGAIREEGFRERKIPLASVSAFTLSISQSVSTLPARVPIQEFDEYLSALWELVLPLSLPGRGPG